MKFTTETMTDSEVQALKRSYLLDTYLWSFDDKVEAVVSEVEAQIYDDSSRKRGPVLKEIEKRKASIKVILLNLLKVWHIAPTEWTSISLSSGAYSKAEGLNQQISYRFIKRAWDGLLALDYFDYVEGYSATTAISAFSGKQQGSVTRMRASSKAVSYLIEDHGLTLDMTCHLLAKECIILKEDDTEESFFYRKVRRRSKPSIPYEDTPEIISMRDKLRRINLLLSRTAICLNMKSSKFREMQEDLLEGNDVYQRPVDLSANYLQRIFNKGSFTQGGRFFNAWWVTIRKEYRSLITLDGEPTIEIDYVGMNPTMLYAMKGHELNGDPYKPEGVLSEVTRDDIKLTFNKLVFGDKIPTITPKGAVLPKGMKYKHVVQAVIDRHNILEEYFGKAMSGTMQYRDSCIVEDVLLQLADKGIPSLPIHDSFIVKKGDQRALEQVMTQIFKDHTGVKPQLRIEAN